MVECEAKWEHLGQRSYMEDITGTRERTSIVIHKPYHGETAFNLTYNLNVDDNFLKKKERKALVLKSYYS